MRHFVPNMTDEHEILMKIPRNTPIIPGSDNGLAGEKEDKGLTEFEILKRKKNTRRTTGAQESSPGDAYCPTLIGKTNI